MSRLKTHGKQQGHYAYIADVCDVSDQIRDTVLDIILV